LVDVSVLLAHLQDRYQSGETLAQRLGISRAAVWKQVEALRQAGYPVQAQKGRGYRLIPGTPTPEALEALRNGHFGAFYAYLGTVQSTQDVLKNWALDGAAEGSVVLAEGQEKGRGRRGRPWDSEPGHSLTFSVLLRPRLPFSTLPLLTLAAGLALCEACGVGGLKWPNDLMVADKEAPKPTYRKMAGVLLEAQISGEEVAYAILGVGLNVHQAGRRTSEIAYLDEFVVASRVQVLARFLERLEARYTQLHHDPGGVLHGYKAKSYTLGQQVRVTTPRGVLLGQATDIAPDGALVVQNAGTTHHIGAGDVELVGYLGGSR
jgi:BirA family biotin operon repressor/biotin-[acetyl-CoA-carboxylase] ligase